MFDHLTAKLSQAFKTLTGQSQLTARNIQDAIEKVRIALLEADVALSLIDPFLQRVQDKAIGQMVLTQLNPQQAFIKIVYDELVALLGKEKATLSLKATPPVVILLAGLQGSGKTTTAAKIAKWIQKSEKKKILLVSLDIYRPAAMQQLEHLAHQIECNYFPATPTQTPLEISQSALEYATKQGIDVVILDSAGRLHIDEEMMTEITAIHQKTHPHETLFVVDSMTGQDAINTAKEFNDALSLTGLILTKTDGDTRGGAALSIRMVTGKPIYFLGTGEKLDGLEIFHPDRLASRILGMGDILTLVEEAEERVNQQEARKVAEDVLKNKRFDFESFRTVILQVQQMGGLNSMMSKLPGMGQLSPELKSKVQDKQVLKVLYIIDSMTRKERKFPALIKGPRKIRIAKGSGTTVADVNQLLKQFENMQKMMQKGMGNLLKRMQGLQQQFPSNWPRG